MTEMRVILRYAREHPEFLMRFKLISQDGTVTHHAILEWQCGLEYYVFDMNTGKPRETRTFDCMEDVWTHMRTMAASVNGMVEVA